MSAPVSFPASGQTSLTGLRALEAGLTQMWRSLRISLVFVVRKGCALLLEIYACTSGIFKVCASFDPVFV